MTKYYNVRGAEIEQAFQKIPFLEPFYTEFEKVREES